MIEGHPLPEGSGTGPVKHDPLVRGVWDELCTYGAAAAEQVYLSKQIRSHLAKTPVNLKASQTEDPFSWNCRWKNSVLMAHLTFSACSFLCSRGNVAALSVGQREMQHKTGLQGSAPDLSKEMGREGLGAGVSLKYWKILEWDMGDFGEDCENWPRLELQCL